MYTTLYTSEQEECDMTESLMTMLRAYIILYMHLWHFNEKFLHFYTEDESEQCMIYDTALYSLHVHLRWTIECTRKSQTHSKKKELWEINMFLNHITLWVSSAYNTLSLITVKLTDILMRFFTFKFLHDCFSSDGFSDLKSSVLFLREAAHIREAAYIREAAHIEEVAHIREAACIREAAHSTVTEITSVEEAACSTVEITLIREAADSTVEITSVKEAAQSEIIFTDFSAEELQLEKKKVKKTEDEEIVLVFSK